ncbi:MAG TPA: LEA type 2 family protein [Puia sp.]|nr:LEA type 2 family protein [Puia sp.]
MRDLKLVGLIVLIGLAGCRQPEPLDYYGFQNLQVSAVVGGQTDVSATAKLYNPNRFSVKVKRAEVDIKVNGQHAGHSLLDSTIFIPARDTFYVPVTLQLDMRGLFNNALQMLMGKREATVDLDGKVKINRGLITFSRKFHYEGKQDLSSLMSAGQDF